MNARARLSSKSQIVVPKAVREKLGLKPGDQVVFREADGVIRLERAAAEDDPFAAFSEWSSEADEEAYADL